MNRLPLARSRSCSRVALAIHLVMLGSILCGGAVAVAQAGTAPAAPADNALRQEWQEGLAALGTGKFADAFRLLHEVAKKDSADESVGQVDKWLAGFEKLQTERAERTRKDYDTYVSWAKEDSKAEKWHRAIRSAGMAFNATDNEEAFRNEPWFKTIVTGAEQEAAANEAASKWIQAARIYVRLLDIFPRKKEYKDALDRCQARIRLDYTFTPDSDWESAVADISPEMAIDAFNKIGSEYLTEPDFRAAAVAALKHILMMTEETKLAKVFKRMENKEALAEFRDRVQARLKAAEDAEEVGEAELVTHFKRVLEINRETELFPQTVLVHEFVHGALKPLDPFSDMLWPADLAEFNKHTQGHFSGVGVSIHKDPGEPLKVVSPLEDSPAYKAGLQAGDAIVAVNGQSTKKMTITQAVNIITGTPGTTVTLTIKRPSLDKEFDVKLERQDITILSMKGFERDETGKWKYMIDPVNKIAYMRMTNFTEGTIDELRTIIRKLRRQEGMRGLIFDLRGNPGGPLKSAVDVSDLFLEGRKKIVATKDRHEKPWEMSSSSGTAGHFSDFPMIILVNGSSASASEIVSGALQVHGRALIVGERSFGKGSVQQVLRLATKDLAFLKLTTAHYYLPNGRCLHRDDDSVTWGVDPDVEVKLVPKEIIKSIEMRLSSDVLRGKNQDNLSKDLVKSVTSLRLKPATKPADAKDKDKDKDTDKDKEGDEEDLDLDDDWPEDQRPDPNDFPEIDPQMDAALMLMRVRLATEQPWPLTNRAQEVATVTAPPAKSDDKR